MQELPEALGPLAHASPECLFAIATPGVSTDAAMVVLQALLSRMEVMAEGPYRVELDQSKKLLTYRDLCNATLITKMKSDSGRRNCDHPFSAQAVFRDPGHAHMLSIAISVIIVVAVADDSGRHRAGLASEGFRLAFEERLISSQY